MMRILIAYGTTEGHTQRIAEFLAAVFRQRGCQAYAVNLERPGTLDPGDYDGVIVGGSLHIGKYQRGVRQFAKQHRYVLQGIPSAFFSVSLAAHGPGDTARAEVQATIEKFVEDTGWRPAKVGIFAGALLYTRYSFFTRWVMKQIARRSGSRDLDTTRDYIYTDWRMVKLFAEEFLEQLAGQPAQPELVGAGQL